MAKIVEFSAYKTKKKIVENLVNFDTGAKKFFEFFPEVTYVDDIETILKYCVKNNILFQKFLRLELNYKIDISQQTKDIILL